jgi:hypothetical protein
MRLIFFLIAVSAVESIWKTTTDDPLACLLREGGAPGCLREVLLESMGSLKNRLSRRNPVVRAGSHSSQRECHPTRP